MWPASRIDLGQASVLDAEFLLEQGDLVGQAIDLGGLPGPRVEGVGSPAAGAHDGVVGQGDDVQDG